MVPDNDTASAALSTDATGHASCPSTPTTTCITSNLDQAPSLPCLANTPSDSYQENPDSLLHHNSGAGTSTQGNMDPDTATVDHSVLSTMHEGIKLKLAADNSMWIDVTYDIRSSVRYCYMYIISACRSSANSNPVSLAFTIIINNDLTWQFYIGSNLIEATKVECLASFPSVVNSDAVCEIFKVLEWHKTCPAAGNPDEKYVHMLRIKKDS